MPRYIVSGQTQPSGGGGSGGSGGDCCCPSTTRFFQNITDKLLKMTQSLKTQFEELKKNACGQKARGAILAEVDAPKMTLGVKTEYIEYIRRFGPPDNGVFDECKLEDLRKELGIESY